MQKKIPSSNYADMLTVAEWELSSDAIDKLNLLNSCPELLKEARKFREEYEKSPKNFPEGRLLQLKQTMFEVRFAIAINRTKYSVENKYKTGVDGTDVDFKLTDTEQEWLIELTNPITSQQVKDNTKILENGLQEYQSITSDQHNAPEVTDIIKIQKVIFSKVSNEECKPIKFPLISTSKAYHIIVVSMNSFNGSISDKDDYTNIVYGSKALSNSFHQRLWYDSEKKESEMIKGVFDEIHVNPQAKTQAKILQERVHAICFIKEKFEEKKVE
jgi:hypothetical protein